MGRLIGIDYGRKRCGIAITDPLKISINPFPALEPSELLGFLKDYISREEVEKLLIGWPTHKDGTETYLVKEISDFLSKFAKLFPEISIIKVDESFSSAEARQLVFQSNLKKKKRKDKTLIDQLSAVIIVKRYLEDL